MNRPLAILGMLLAAALLACCGARAAVQVVQKVEQKVPDLSAPAPTTAAAIRTELDETRRDKAKTLAREAYLEAALDQVEQDNTKRLLLWVAIGCLAGLIPCVFGFFYAPLPGLKRVAFYAGATLVVVCLFALGARQLLPWLPWILASVFAVGGLVAVVVGGPWLRHLVELAHEHAEALPIGRLRDRLLRLKAATKPPPPKAAP